jgi:uncharacterized membrane protein YGL010W
MMFENVRAFAMLPNTKGEQYMKIIKARSLQDWLDAYAVSHQNPTNKAVHWFCVPVITWTVLALLWQVSFGQSVFANAASVFIVMTLLFYLRLSLTITLGIATFACFCVWLIFLHERFVPLALWQSALALFVIAWIGQFWGHKVEGKKPSFFEDLQFLLIGPAWLLSFVYRRLGIPLLLR